MSRIRADKLVNRSATGAPSFPLGAVVTGVITATNFKKADGTEVGGVIVGINTAGVSTFTDLIVDGNLTVQGTTTTIDTAVTAVDSLAVDGVITTGGKPVATTGKAIAMAMVFGG